MSDKDPLTLGIPNICFSHANDLPETDDRLEGYKKQRLERGFDNTELWSLDYTIAKFIIPRLQAFQQHKAGYPACFSSRDEWDNVLNIIIKGFEFRCSNAYYGGDEEQMDSWSEAKELFMEYFDNLWI